MGQLKRITLRLARNPQAGAPEGDPHRGYTVVAPLRDDGSIDVDAWRAMKDKCTVVRFSPDPDERADGLLTHRGSHWYFHYDEDDEGADEPIYRLGDHRFVFNEYLSVKEQGEEALVYRVADVSAI